MILSKSNPTVKELAALKERKARKERGVFLVEGEKAIRDLYSSGITVRRMIYRGDYAGERSEPCVVLGADAFRSVSDLKTPQGVIAEAEIPEYPLRAPQGDCLLLDGLQNPDNVGAILRTANAVGIREAYLVDCADAYSPKCVRASMGGVFYVKTYAGARDEVLSVLRGMPIIAADMAGESVFCFTPPAKFALAIGNEGQGISEEVASSAAYTVKIPMEERTESLNAAVSAGILLYALRRDRIKF